MAGMVDKKCRKIKYLVSLAEDLEPDQVDLLIVVAMETLPNSDDSDNSSDGENKIRRRINPSPRRAKTKSSNSVSSASSAVDMVNKQNNSNVEKDG